jgi:hypothetical protein
MSLLRPKAERKGTRVALRAYTTLLCPFNGHQVSWCRGLCEPINDHGHCGRLAPHLMTDRTQAAIANFKFSYKNRPLKSFSYVQLGGR